MQILSACPHDEARRMTKCVTLCSALLGGSNRAIFIFARLSRMIMAPSGHMKVGNGSYLLSAILKSLIYSCDK
jgi:hypothetical protein